MNNRLTSDAQIQLIRKVNLFGAWCGFGYVVFLFVGWLLIAGYFPLHQPSAGAQAIKEFYTENIFLVRVGLVIAMWAAALLLPFIATVVDWISEVEGRRGPLTTLTILSGFANAMFTFYPLLWWLIASYRADVRPIELTLMINDIAWLQFVGALSLGFPMWITIGIAALSDRSARPKMPRWVGFFSLWMAVIMVLGQLIYFFYSGPFAWNGLLALWLPAAAVSAWMVVLSFNLLKAYSRSMTTCKNNA